MGSIFRAPLGHAAWSSLGDTVKRRGGFCYPLCGNLIVKTPTKQMGNLITQQHFPDEKNSEGGGFETQLSNGQEYKIHRNS